MPPVSRHEERRFWKDLCKLFNKLIDDVKNGGGILNKGTLTLEGGRSQATLLRKTAAVFTMTELTQHCLYRAPLS